MTDHAGQDQQIAPLLSKSSAWSYENEFRLISDEEGDPKDTIVTTGGKKDIPPKSLTAVILGCLAPDSTKQAIIQMIAESRHPPALQRAVRMHINTGLRLRMRRFNELAFGRRATRLRRR